VSGCGGVSESVWVSGCGGVSESVWVSGCGGVSERVWVSGSIEYLPAIGCTSQGVREWGSKGGSESVCVCFIVSTLFVVPIVVGESLMNRVECESGE